MKTKKLLKVSLIISIIGIFILFFLTELYPKPTVSILDLKENNSKYLNQEILIKGFLSKTEDINENANFIKENCYSVKKILKCYFFLFDNKNNSVKINGNFLDTDLKEISKGYLEKKEIVIEGILKEYNQEIFLEAIKVYFLV